MKLKWALIWIFLSCCASALSALTLPWSFQYWGVLRENWRSFFHVSLEMGLFIPLKMVFVGLLSLIPLYYGRISRTRFKHIGLIYVTLLPLYLLIHWVGLVLTMYGADRFWQVLGLLLLYVYAFPNDTAPMNLTIPIMLQIVLPVGTVVFALCFDYLAHFRDTTS